VRFVHAHSNESSNYIRDNINKTETDERTPLWEGHSLKKVINLPFIVLGYRQVGRKFAIKSILAISGLSIYLATIHYPDVTPDKLFTALFGGFF